MSLLKIFYVFLQRHKDTERRCQRCPYKNVKDRHGDNLKAGHWQFLDDLNLKVLVGIAFPLEHSTLVFSTQLPGLSESMFSKAKSLWSAAIALRGRKTFKEEGQSINPSLALARASFSYLPGNDLFFSFTSANADTLLLTWMVCSAWHRG